jgi:hypothetical protein
LSVVGIRHVEIEARLEQVSQQNDLGVLIAQTGLDVVSMFTGHNDDHVVGVEVFA